MPITARGAAARQSFFDNRMWKMPVFCFCVTFGGYFLPKAIRQLEGGSQSRPCSKFNCRDGFCVWSYCLHLQAPFVILAAVALFIGVAAGCHFIKCPCRRGKAPNEPHHGIVQQPVITTSEDCDRNPANNIISTRPIIIINPFLEDDDASVLDNGSTKPASPPPKYIHPPSYDDCVFHPDQAMM